MEGFLSPAEGAKLIPGFLAGNKEDQEKFYENYQRILRTYAQKYLPTISRVSLGMFQYEDIYQFLWLRILEKLPKFDIARANVVTWMYMVCYSECNMLYRSLKTHDYKLFEGEFEDEETGELKKGVVYTSINDTILDKDGDNIELVEVLITPHTAMESYIMSEIEIYSYVYLLKDFISKLTKTQKMTYWHMIKGLKQAESADIMGISQSYVARVRYKVMDKAIKLWERKDNLKIDHSKAFDFSMQLMSKDPDYEIAERLNTDLAVIKICREILNITDIHSEVG